MVAALVTSSTSGTTDTQSDNKNCPVPAGAAAEHVAVLFLEIWLDTSTDPVITWPSGFTQRLYLESTTDGFQRLYIATKPLTAADTGNYAMSWAGSYWNQAQCDLWSGIDNTTPLDVAIATATTVNNSTMPSLNLTTVTDGCGMIHVIANENSATGTAPTGYTERQEANYLRHNTKVTGTAGSETPSGGSISTSTVKLGALIALRPASSGGAMNLSNAAGSGAAQALSLSKAADLGSATGSGTAQPLATSKALTLAAAAGTGTPQAMTFSKALGLDTATGSGAPAAIAADKALALAQAAGSGAVQALAPSKALGLQNATGTGTAQPMSLTPEAGAGEMLLGTATGTGAAQPMTFSKNLALSPAAGSGAVQAVALTKALELAAATGAGAAQGLAASKQLAYAAAVGSGAAQVMSLSGAYEAPTEWTISTPAAATVDPRSQAFTAVTRATPYTAVTREHE